MNSEKETSRQTSSGYFINQELIEEMVRLNRQGRIFTEAMGGVLAEQSRRVERGARQPRAGA